MTGRTVASNCATSFAQACKKEAQAKDRVSAGIWTDFSGWSGDGLPNDRNGDAPAARFPLQGLAVRPLSMPVDGVAHALADNSLCLIIPHERRFVFLAVVPAAKVVAATITVLEEPHLARGRPDGGGVDVVAHAERELPRIVARKYIGEPFTCRPLERRLAPDAAGQAECRLVDVPLGIVMPRVVCLVE